MSAFEPVAVVRRSGMDESWHNGAVVGLAADGSLAFAIGDVGAPTYPRSANKPMQAVGMGRAGLRLPPSQLALVCASHSGTPAHVAGVRTILEGAGLDESALGNVADLPLDASAGAEVLREGRGRERILMNCSGKHAGMLATCVHNGWAHDTSYLSPEHPVQDAITAAIAELTGVAPPHIGVDGCGAPAHAMSLLALARGFRSIALGEPAVADAMRANPDLVGGPGRDVTRFMERVPGLVAKDGAEGVYAAAMPDGRAVALKIADGATRARPPVMAAALAMLGVDVSGAAAAWSVSVLGAGHAVGDVRAAGPLAHAWARLVAARG